MSLLLLSLIFFAANIFADTLDSNLEALTVLTYSQKREQPLMEVPLSVSTYTSGDIDSINLQTMNDLHQLSSGLSVNPSQSALSTNLTLRGIGTSSNNLGIEQSVGLFVDGVYRSQTSAAFANDIDIDTIEIIKGPQGTLFGRNTSAGVVNILTQEPEFGDNTDIEVSTSNLGLKQAKASKTGTLVTDVLAYRVSASQYKEDGIYENILDGKNMNNKNRYNLRGQLLWDVNNDATVKFIADFINLNENCCVSAPLFYDAYSAELLKENTRIQMLPSKALNDLNQVNFHPSKIYGAVVNPFSGKVAVNTPFREKIRDGGLSGQLNWSLSNATHLNAIASYRASKSRSMQDADLTSADLITDSSEVSSHESSIEIRWSSEIPQTFDWMTGFYYYNKKSDLEDTITFGKDKRDYFEALTDESSSGIIGDLSSQGFDVPEGTYLDGLISDLEQTTGISLLSQGQFTRSELSYNAESMALFGHVNWNLHEKLIVGMGARYAIEEKTSRYHNVADHPYADLTSEEIKNSFRNSANPLIREYANADQSDIFNEAPGSVKGSEILTSVIEGNHFALPFTDFSAQYNDKLFSGSLSMTYLWDDELSIYSRFANGYKSGGLNLNRLAVGPSQKFRLTSESEKAVLKPEKVNSFEVGFKSSYLAGKLQLNGALFYQDLDNYQFQLFTGSHVSLIEGVNIKGKGMEMSYRYKLHNNWSLNGEATVQDINYVDHQSHELFDVTGEVLSFRADGNPAIYTPDVSLSNTLTYTYPVNDAVDILAHVNHVYRSEYSLQERDVPELNQGDSSVINVSLSIAGRQGDWSVGVWGKNITDEEILQSINNTPLQTNSFNAQINAPVSYGVTAKLNF